MEYKKIKIEYVSNYNEDTKEKIINLLKEYGIYELELLDEFEENELDYNDNFKYESDSWQIIFYLLDNNYFEKKLNMIIENLNEISKKDTSFVFDINYSVYDDEKNKDEWKKYFKTTRILENIVIKPSWDNSNIENENDIVLEIDPGMAFGTGTHETTSLCIEHIYNELVNIDNKEKRKLNLIDIGCGSGILMLLAKKMGIEEILGIDIDKNVENVVVQNLKRNNILSGYDVKIGNLIDNVDKKYDYIVSNILVDVLENLIKDIKKICHLSSTIIFSGILLEKSEKFIEKAESYGFYVVEKIKKNEWISLKMKLSPKNIIAIDGPAGSGKSTIAQLVADRLGYNYLNTGSTYRAYAYKLVKENVDYLIEDELLKYINKLDLTISDNRYYLDGEDITDKLRDENIGNIASKIVSVNKHIRQYLVDVQRKMANNRKVVLDGRDIGTVVFPNAKLKIFLTASIEERANRRKKELQEKGIEFSFEDIYNDILKRDESDKTRKESPLIKTKEYIEIDTTNMGISEIVDFICNLAKERDMV